jgi:hypothetical protein
MNLSDLRARVPRLHQLAAQMGRETDIWRATKARCCLANAISISVRL